MPCTGEERGSAAPGRGLDVPRAGGSGDVPRAGEEDKVDVPRAGEERRKCRAREEVDVPHAGKERGKHAGGFHRLRAEVSV